MTNLDCEGMQMKGGTIYPKRQRREHGEIVVTLRVFDKLEDSAKKS